MLIDAELGDLLLNLDQVRTIEALPSLPQGFGRSTVTFTDGSKRVVQAPAKWFARFAGHIIPAPPGYRVISVCRSLDELWFHERPVVAFRYHGERHEPLDPITDEGGMNNDDWALIRPDGTVTDYGATFDSVEAYKREVAEERAVKGEAA